MELRSSTLLQQSMEEGRLLQQSKNAAHMQELFDNELLRLAARRGQPEEARRLIAGGVDVAAKGAAGWTPLHHASDKSHGGVATLLLDAGADVAATDSAGLTPLHRAASIAVARVLLAAGADVAAKASDGEIPLHRAARYGHEGVLTVLVDEGSDVSARDAFGMTPLHWASWEGRGGAAKLLLQAGADVAAIDDNQDTPLHVAVRQATDAYGHIRVLLHARADVSARDSSGSTPLHWAARMGRTQVCTPYTLHPAPFNLHVTPHTLHFTPQPYTLKQLVKVLLDAGADVAAKEMDRSTPLHRAVALSGREQVGHPEALLRGVLSTGFITWRLIIRRLRCRVASRWATYVNFPFCLEEEGSPSGTSLGLELSVLLLAGRLIKSDNSDMLSPQV